jgi:heptosyltransferase-3
MILTLPMASVIRKHLPETKIVFGVRHYTRPIVESSEDVDLIVTIDPDSSASEIAKVIREVNADALFIPSPRFRIVLAAFLSRTPVRVGTGYRWYSFLFNRKLYDHRKTAEYNEAEYNIRMLQAIGIDSSEYPLPTLAIAAYNNTIFNPYAVLHIFTGGSADSWSIEKFKETASWLSREKGFEIVFTGEKKHREFLLTVAHELKPLGIIVHIHTELTLIELAGLLKQASLVVSAATGPGHLAAALGAPTIGLFQLATPLSKERWGFRGEKVTNLEPLNAPRGECPACKACDCMASITTDQVIHAATTLIHNEY